MRDDPHGPVVGLTREGHTHPRKRKVVNARPVIGEDGMRPEGISVRDLMPGTELVEILRQAKVGQVYVPMYIDQNVLRLEVSVDDSLSMELVKGDQDLRYEMTNHVERNATPWEPTRIYSTSNITDPHVSDDVEGGCVIEGRDER